MTINEVHVNFYAAARDAFGSASTNVSPNSMDEILDSLTKENLKLSQVLLRCSILIDGEICRDFSKKLIGGESVDILPPFAGGYLATDCRHRANRLNKTWIINSVTSEFSCHCLFKSIANFDC